MDSRRFGIIAELRNNEEEIITFFKGLNSEQLEMMVYPDDPGWTVQQVLVHFTTIEGPMQWLFKDITDRANGSDLSSGHMGTQLSYARFLALASRATICQEISSKAPSKASLLDGKWGQGLICDLMASI